MTGNIDDLIHYRINRAFETLKEAETMVENGFGNAAVNRTYYACYYAVNALLLKKNIKTTTHKGIRQMFGLHYVQSGLISKEMAKVFTDLYDRRQTGDYDDFIVYDKDLATRLLALGNEFVNEVEKLLQ